MKLMELFTLHRYWIIGLISLVIFLAGATYITKTSNTEDSQLIEITVGAEKFHIFPRYLVLSDGIYIRFMCLGAQCSPYIIVVTKQDAHFANDVIYRTDNLRFGLIRLTEKMLKEEIVGLRINVHFFLEGPLFQGAFVDS